MNTTPKSTLLHNLEERINHKEADHFHVYIIDVMFVISGLTNLPQKFKGIARHVLKIDCATVAKEIHVLADHYEWTKEESNNCILFLKKQEVNFVVYSE